MPVLVYYTEFLVSNASSFVKLDFKMDNGSPADTNGWYLYNNSSLTTAALKAAPRNNEGA